MAAPSSDDDDGATLHPIPSIIATSPRRGDGDGDDDETLSRLGSAEDQSNTTTAYYYFPETDQVNSRYYPVACVECLRASSGWAVGDDVVPMRIACTYAGTVGAVGCDGCVEGGRGCTMAASGMIGDLVDVLLIIEDAQSLCTKLDEEKPHDEQWNDNYALSRKDRQRAARAANACVEAFLVADKAHREEFGLDAESVVENKLKYENLILYRRYLAMSFNPRRGGPANGVNRAQREAEWQYSVLPRLSVVDRGFMTLGAAKERFAHVFEAAVAGLAPRGGGAFGEATEEN